MEDGRRRDSCPGRGASVAADASLRGGDPLGAASPKGSCSSAARLSSPAAGRITERRTSAPMAVHQRHMPMEPRKFHIPRKTKEKKALFQFVSSESREFEDMKTILTSGYIDTNSAGGFAYSNPRLVHSELLEKEFVEKRREMKADGRTDKELEESYCFLLTNSAELPVVCEKGLTVGQSKSTLLGNPSKGVYLSRYSDLLQTIPLSPGATGELLILKVMKGKVKSVYENMKILQDPTPRFDSHVAKNASKVTSPGCFRAFELTQLYSYEYLFDELRERPRHVCPYAVVSFHVKGKDAPLSIKPTPPIRFSSQFSESSKEGAQFTVWSGDLVKNKLVLFPVCLQSSRTPSLPLRLPESLEMGSAMRLDDVTRLLPSGLLNYDAYSGSKEVVTGGHHCSLLEVTDRERSTANVTALLRELETKQLVLVNPLPDKGFLFLLSSVQMCKPAERGETWRRSLQALFVFPEPRDVSTIASLCSSSSQDGPPPPPAVMPRLSDFIPALHHSLLGAKANPPPNLSAGVALQMCEYLSGVNDGSVRRHAAGEYDPVLDDEAKPCPAYLRVNADAYLRSYLSNPAAYLLSVALARQAVEAHRGAERSQRKTSSSDGQKIQQLLDQILACKKNAEAEVRREEGDGSKVPERKRKMDQRTAERALKYFKASLETGRPDRVPVGETKTPASHLSFASLLTSSGLKDVDLREDGSDMTAKLLRQLKGLVRAASLSPAETPEEPAKESSPFGRLAVKLGLPANCDVDLRKQEELEEQTAGSVSSLEGFSPGSHSGEPNHQAGRGGGGRLERKAAANEEQQQQQQQQQEEEEWEIPWVLIPITGLCSERYSRRDRNIPQDPRFQRVDSAPSVAATETKSLRTSPTSSPEATPPPFHCSSPDPSPPPSPSQCPSPDPSPPPSPSQCPSPEPSPPSPPLCDSSPWPRPHASPRRQPVVNETEPVNEQMSPLPFPGAPSEKEPSPWIREVKAEEPNTCPWTLPSPAPAINASPSLSGHAEESGGDAEKEAEAGGEEEEEEEVQPRMKEQQEVEVEMLGEQNQDGGSLFSSSRPGDIDSVVYKHLQDFSAGIQLVLQDEGVDYSRAPPPHSSSETQHLLPYSSLPPFSPYVSFFHPRPPVAAYAGSLHDNIDDLLARLEDRRSRQTPTAESSLAESVSDFVASVRAGKAPADLEVALVESPACSRVEAPREPYSTNWRNAPSPQLCLTAGGSLQGSSTRDTEHHDADAAATLLCNLNLPGANAGVPGLQPAHSFNPAHTQNHAPVPSTTHISSVIDQLEPNVLSNLAEILKDLRRKTPHFYVHSAEPGDRVCEEVEEHLLNLGNVHQSPVDFLHQDNTENGLLVIIRNKDVAGHIHQIPGLMSLKRHSSVVFVGIDSLDDIKNNSCIELFVSGGCIVSDELVLSPDVITRDRLAALLRLLEENSSPEGLWRWKIHCKTHKKLKEQARFRRDAADLLDLLSAYQKRQIVEFLPYHRCDMSGLQTPDLECLTELQARYTQFRHTLYLTEHSFEKFPSYSNGGIIVAGIQEMQHSFSRLVGCHSIKDKQLFVEDLLAPKGLTRPPDHRDAFADPLHAPPSASRPQKPLPQPGADPAHRQASDQIVPDGGAERVPLASSRDMEVLQQAIRELRAERLKQLEQLKLQQQLLELQDDLGEAAFPDAVESDGAAAAPPPEAGRFPSGRNTVATTPDSIHSGLQLEAWGGERAEPSPPERGEPRQVDTEPSDRSTAAADRRSETVRHQEPNRSSGSPAGGVASSFSRSSLEKEVAPHSRIPVLLYRDSDPKPAPTTQTRPVPVQQNHAPFSQRPQRGAGLLHTPPPPFHTQHFHPGPLLGPLHPLAAMRGLMRPPPLWPGRLAPTGSPLLWGFPQPSMDLLGRGGNMFRGARPGGGYGRM